MELESRIDKDQGAFLVWEDLTVVVPEWRKGRMIRKLLSGLNGYAEPGRIMAIIGPSGSGKSTLLDSLAGRLSANVIMTGHVRLYGKKSTDHKDVSYVTQEDVFLGTFTVRETLTYTAHLRLPSTMTKNQIKEVVETTITKMGLQECAETKIGNWHMRGLSSGEKRRLSISLEILTQPSVLFLDEPTSGLDAASAFFVIRALRNIAVDGRIVVCSIHQPTSDVFDLFDDLFLLSGGEAVYFGDAKKAVQFFDDSGFPCPARRNPPDHFLRCINSDFDKVIAALMQAQKNCGISTSSQSLMNMTTAEIKATLVEKYKNSIFSVKANQRILDISLLEEIEKESNRRNARWGKQLCTLTHRSFMNMTREIGYYWLRIVFYMIVAVSAGSFFFNMGTSNQAIYSRGKCIGFIYGLMICLSVGGVPFFIEELKVYKRERCGRHYGEAVFVLSNFISSIPFVMATSLSSGAIIYFMVNFHPGFSHYCYFCINLFSCIIVTESFMMIVASLVPELFMAIGVGTGLIVIYMMASELFRRIPELPKFFWRYPMSYISYASWAMEGQYKNDLIGLEFDPPVAGQPKLKGKTILRTTFGIDPDHSKWWDLTALLCLVLSYKLLFFMVLKYKDRVSSMLHRFYAQRTLQKLLKRPS